MVVLAVSVLSRSGKILVSRPYAEMICDSIEGYLREFLRMVEPGQKETHHFETKNVRYVYQPIQSLYLLLVTNKQSKITEDKSTLNLLGAHPCLKYMKSSPLDEEAIRESALELIFYFDNVLNPNHVEFQQLLSDLNMQRCHELSHILKTLLKVNETKEVMKQKVREIDNEKLNDSLTGASSVIKDAMDPSTSIKTFLGADNSLLRITHASEPIIQVSDPSSSSSKSPGVPSKSVCDSSGGLQLKSDPTAVTFTVHEDIEVTRKSYTSTEFNLHGTLYIHIPPHLGAITQAKIMFLTEEPKIIFEPDPRINRKLLDVSHILLLGDIKSDSHDDAVPILKWCVRSRDNAHTPLIVDHHSSRDELYVMYEATTCDVRDIMITIQTPKGIHNKSKACTSGTSWWDVDREVGTCAVKWFIPFLDDSIKSGSLRIDFSSLLQPPHIAPVSVSFTSGRTVSHFEIESVVPKRRGDPPIFCQQSRLYTKKYMVFPRISDGENSSDDA